MVGLSSENAGLCGSPALGSIPAAPLQPRRLPEHGWQRLQHPRPAPVRTTPQPGPPPARAAPSPSHSSATRAEPQRQRWPPPRGLDPEKLLSSPSTTTTKRKRRRKIVCPPPRRRRQEARESQLPPAGCPHSLRSRGSRPVPDLAAPRGSGSSWPLGSDEGPKRGSLSTPPPPHVSPPKLQRKSRALGAKSYKTRGKRKIISCCRKCCKQGEGRALQTARARERRVKHLSWTWQQDGGEENRENRQQRERKQDKS